MRGAAPGPASLGARRLQANEALQGDHDQTLANSAKGEKPGEHGANRRGRIVTDLAGNLISCRWGGVRVVNRSLQRHGNQQLHHFRVVGRDGKRRNIETENGDR